MDSSIPYLNLCLSSLYFLLSDLQSFLLSPTSNLAVFTFLHLSLFVFTCFYLSLLVFTCLHLSSFVFICLHLGSALFLSSNRHTDTERREYTHSTERREKTKISSLSSLFLVLLSFCSIPNSSVRRWIL